MDQRAFLVRSNVDHLLKNQGEEGGIMGDKSEEEGVKNFARSQIFDLIYGLGVNIIFYFVIICYISSRC